MSGERVRVVHRVTVEFITRSEPETAEFSTATEARTFIGARAQDSDAYHIFYVTTDGSGVRRTIELSVYRAPETREWQACAGQRGL